MDLGKIPGPAVPTNLVANKQMRATCFSFFFSFPLREPNFLSARELN